MEGSAPPVYDEASQDDVAHRQPYAMLNVVPLPGSLSFVRGHLGFDPHAYLHGELQTKIVKPCTPLKLTLTFVGVERINDDSIEIVRESKVLWGQGAAGPSNSATARQDTPPESLEFELELTRDLPHCIHLHDSAFEYSLVATLEAEGEQPVTTSTPAHLRRTSPDMAARGPSTKVISADAPVNIKMRTARSTLHASEPVDVRIRIDIPPLDVVTSGLRLRTVTAELTRDVSVNGRQLDPVVLQRSGKSARFSPSKPVLIKLLVPSKPSSCESITQSTIYHRITFSIRVTVSFQNSQQQRQDVVLTQEIVFLPDPITPIRQPSPDAESESATSSSPPRLPETADETTEPAVSTATSSPPVTNEKEPIPTYTEAQDEVDFSEEEYDGYEASAPAPPDPGSIRIETVGTSAGRNVGSGDEKNGTGVGSEEEHLPSIDDDTSPPSVDAESVAKEDLLVHVDSPTDDPLRRTQKLETQAPRLDDDDGHEDATEPPSLATPSSLTIGLTNEPPPYGTSPRRTEHNAETILRPPPYYGS